MFDFDSGKVFIVGLVALVVIGPKELPRVLRALGQIVGKLRQLGSELQSQFRAMMMEADVDGVTRELDTIKRSTYLDIALNPKTVMRGELPSLGKAASSPVTAAPGAMTLEVTYASAEMRDYLGPVTAGQPTAPEASALAH